MAPVTSTVPGAISLLLSYFQQAADASGLDEIAVYDGVPIEFASKYWLMVGSWPDGEQLSGGDTGFAAIPGMTKLFSEQYTIECNLRAWQGDSDPASRRAEAFGLYNAVYELLANDIGGSGQLTPSGSWAISNFTCPAAGPLGGAGWGIVLNFGVHVWNVQLTG